MIDYNKVDEYACELREKYGADNNMPLNMPSFLQQMERLTVMMVKLGPNISGMTVRKNDILVIAINTEQSIGRQRFSLAHELYHVFYDDIRNISVNLYKSNAKDEREKKADAFASYLLAPKFALQKKIGELRKGTDRRLTIEDVVFLEQFYGMSHQAMLWRLMDEGYLTRDEKNSMEGNVKEIALLLGYSEKLYISSGDQPERTYGFYIDMATKLLKEKVISQGKYEELLLEAFRDDIVFGTNEESIDD